MKSTIFALAFTLALPCVAEAVLIDTFDEAVVVGSTSGTATITLPGGDTDVDIENAYAATTGSGILGGRRDYFISQQQSAIGGGGASTVDTGNGVFIYTAGTNIDGGFLIQWDGGTTAPSTGGTNQFSGGGADGALNGLEFNDLGISTNDRWFVLNTVAGAGLSNLAGAFELTLTVWESATEYATATYTTSGSAEEINFFTTDFTAAGGFNISSDDINAITLQGAAPAAGGTFILGNIQAIPEPATLLIWSILGFGCVVIRESRRRNGGLSEVPV